MTKNFKKRNLLIVLSIVAAAVIALSVIYISGRADSKVSKEITIEDAEVLVKDTFKGLAQGHAAGALMVAKDAEITVNSIEFGNNRDAILNCSYSVYDMYSLISENKQVIIDHGYAVDQKLKASGSSAHVNATKIRQALASDLNELIKGAERTEGEITVTLYEVKRN